MLKPPSFDPDTSCYVGFFREFEWKTIDVMEPPATLFGLSIESVIGIGVSISNSSMF